MCVSTYWNESFNFFAELGSNYFRVCLFRGKIEWMKNFEEKMRIFFFFLSVFGWVGRKENKLWGFLCFLSRPTKKFSPQNREKTEERKYDCLINKNVHVYLHMALSVYCSFSPFIYLFPRCFFSSFPSSYVAFYLFIYFYRCSYSFFLFCILLCVCVFFWLFITFFGFNWASFLTKVHE